MKKRKSIVLAGCMLLLLLLCGAAFLFIRRGGKVDNGNLALQRGVIASCDSTEREELSADKAIDGDDQNPDSRWSSANNWEDASHYIELEFPEEISVSFVVLKWERRNMLSYALEGSLDGMNWEIIKSYETAPEENNQKILLDEPVQVRFLRVSIYAVSQNEEDYSNFYQNVSLYEFEVYADKPAAYRLEEPAVETRQDGSRYLVIPRAPQGYEVRLTGADLEQVIGADGTVYDTIQDKTVTVGFLVTDRTGKEEPQEASFVLEVPANSSQETVGNECPAVIPALAEWSGGNGEFTVSADTRVIVDTEIDGGSGENTESAGGFDGKRDDVMQTASLFAEEYRKMTQTSYTETASDAFTGWQICEGTLEDVRPGDIYLSRAPEGSGLGEEGYLCDITDTCVIKAETPTGLRWGTVTILQILSESIDTVPQGKIRDYPLYEVRGFGIDVARKAVSLDTLYAMLETMSWYKMNDLAIHLNDNAILSTSGLTGSVEEAMTADSAFRLESDIANDAGTKLTSEEYFYSKKDFAAFIEDAKAYGVAVVPEIDTPAHSLSITKLFPEYALTAGSETVDQIDLHNEQAKELVKTIWNEALNGEDAAFASAETVNIGMDEYYGTGEEYRKYVVEMNELAQKADKTVRLWGSLSHIEGTLAPPPDNLQMNLWSTVWADPMDMYRAGYSLINMQNNHLYIIPGGGYDYLDGKELYETWEPNRFYADGVLELLPSYSPQMLGAAYMIWNDMSGKLDIGISEYDLYDRFRQPLAVLSVRLWGMGDNASEAVSYEAFSRQAAQTEENRLAAGGGLDGAQAVYDGTVGIEPSYEIRMRVYLEHQEGNMQVEEQILAKSDSPYGKWEFQAVQAGSGKVGFSREGRDYTFDYSLPYGEWVELKVVGEIGRTSLYVNDKLVDTVGSGEAFEEYATFVFPVQYIGEATGSFRGQAKMERIR